MLLVHSQQLRSYLDGNVTLPSQTVHEQAVLRHVLVTNTPVPLYKTFRYSTILDIKPITDGPQVFILDKFCYASIHFTLDNYNME